MTKQRLTKQQRQDEASDLLCSLTCDTDSQEAERIAVRLEVLGFKKYAAIVRADSKSGSCYGAAEAGLL